MEIILNENEKDWVNRYFNTNKHNKIDELIVDLPTSTILGFLLMLANYKSRIYGEARYKVKIKSHKLYIGKEE